MSTQFSSQETELLIAGLYSFLQEIEVSNRELPEYGLDDKEHQACLETNRQEMEAAQALIQKLQANK